MSDKYRTLTVVLDDDYLAEDIEDLMNAILLLQGVHDVSAADPVDGSTYANRVLVRTRAAELLHAAADEIFNSEDL